MRFAYLLIAASLGLAACGGSAPKGPDATIFCTMDIYDPCSTEHDCSTTSCETLTPTLQVCSQACTAGGSACPPTADGAAVECGSGGFCQPAAAVACVIAP